MFTRTSPLPTPSSRGEGEDAAWAVVSRFVVYPTDRSINPALALEETRDERLTPQPELFNHGWTRINTDKKSESVSICVHPWLGNLRSLRKLLCIMVRWYG